ncbi:hypothetical protein [Microcoleus sp. B13-B4]
MPEASDPRKAIALDFSKRIQGRSLIIKVFISHQRFLLQAVFLPEQLV